MAEFRSRTCGLNTKTRTTIRPKLTSNWQPATTATEAWLPKAKPDSRFTPPQVMQPGYAQQWPTRKSCRRFFRYERQAGTHCSHSTPRLQRNRSHLLLPGRHPLRVFHAQPISTPYPTEQGMSCPSFYYQGSDPGTCNRKRIRISNFGFSSLLAPDLWRDREGQPAESPTVVEGTHPNQATDFGFRFVRSQPPVPRN